MKADFSRLHPTRQPSKQEAKRYRQWVTYLTDSKLSTDEIHRRAAAFTEQGCKIPKD